MKSSPQPSGETTKSPWKAAPGLSAQEKWERPHCGRLAPRPRAEQGAGPGADVQTPEDEAAVW